MVCPVVGTKTVRGGDQFCADAENGVRNVVSSRMTAVAVTDRRVHAHRYPARARSPSPIVFPQNFTGAQQLTSARRNLSRAHYTHE